MKELIGRNATERLRELASGRVLLFTQPNLYGLFQERLKLSSPFIYGEMTENPKREEIAIAQQRLKTEVFDCIVAFGGGSVIDFAKAFRYYEQRNIPLIAIPTTAGTGSQATQFAVVYVEGKKTSLDDASLLPDVAIVDSCFIEHSPQYLKACCAMDAYCQGIESFWSRRATKESKAYALETISLCRDWLTQAVTSPDATANEHMARAAHLAGKAINISRTTAAHALSYKITSSHNIPHGHAVALTIAQVFKANLGRIQDEDLLLNTMGISRDGITAHFHQLMSSIGLAYRFAELGISDIREIADSVNAERMCNNPCSFTQKQLYALLLT